MSNSGTICKGRISVHSSRHRLMDYRLYYTTDGMKKIMAQWMSEYPSGFYLQIQPYPKPKKEKDTRIRLDIIKDEPKEKFVRFPAIYDNPKSLY